MKARERDVIDVNRLWGAWVGSRRHGYLVGMVRHSNARLAMQEARAQLPGIRVAYVEER